MEYIISNKLVELVEKHSDEILKRWSTRLINDPTTSSYTEKHLKDVEARARNILNNLGKWISYDTSKTKIGKRYAEEGRELFNMQIPLCEAFRAIITLRRILWLFIINESVFDSAFQMHQMMEMNDRVILFFDRAIYYMTRGYTEAMNQRMKELCDCDEKTESMVFFEKSFYNK